MYSKNCPSKVKIRNSRRGFGTLEMVIIIAVMLTVAMLFRSTLQQYAQDLIQAVFKDSIIEELDTAAK
jgi:Tfp pilus assembly protein FimT